MTQGCSQHVGRVGRNPCFGGKLQDLSTEPGVQGQVWILCSSPGPTSPQAGLLMQSASKSPAGLLPLLAVLNCAHGPSVSAHTRLCTHRHAHTCPFYPELFQPLEHDSFFHSCFVSTKFWCCWFAFFRDYSGKFSYDEKKYLTCSMNCKQINHHPNNKKTNRSIRNDISSPKAARCMWKIKTLLALCRKGENGYVRAKGRKGEGTKVSQLPKSRRSGSVPQVRGFHSRNSWLV